MNIKTGFDHKVTGVMILSLVVYAVVIVMNLQQGNEQGGAKMRVDALFTPRIVPIIFRLFSLLFSHR